MFNRIKDAILDEHKFLYALRFITYTLFAVVSLVMTIMNYLTDKSLLMIVMLIFTIMCLINIVLMFFGKYFQSPY